MNAGTPPRCHTRLPAFVLIAAGALSALTMAFHPAAEGTDAQARLHSLAAISSLSLHVHLAMIGFVVAQWLSLAYLTRLWPASGWVWLAARLYAIGAGAMLGAALVSGFVTGAYLGRALPAVSSAQEALPPVLLAYSANQALAGFGTVFISLAILLWSARLIHGPGRLARLCGAYGIVAGALCVAAYAGGVLTLDVAGMTAVVGAHGVWFCLLGACALRRDRRTPATH
ncbi:hypothetical protein [Lysobacter silvisoli]|uniref:DUF4386 family protein n=1 Tax=Lysobacter silvisoli TaxID=2293254 RepID=A0A371K2K7_9GAMM|nr:hypothetical protein [Lysobacter silvisoli]RDZ28155.1 hypothetical protein DX914_03150 [Lysobacter silvisoli]